MRQPLFLSWSGGKDSALALHALSGSDRYEVTGLLTTVTAGVERISMHGVRRTLLDRQAAALGLPLVTAEIPPGASNDQYLASMGAALAGIQAAGITSLAFGDLFLEDIRRYREEMLAALGLRAVFPLWGRDTAVLAQEFIDLGFGAVVACVDGHAVDPRLAGREYDRDLLADLPPGADPCGENGEFHTFVYRGPVFREPVRFSRGARTVRDDRFHFCDLE